MKKFTMLSAAMAVTVTALAAVPTQGNSDTRQSATPFRFMQPAKAAEANTAFGVSRNDATKSPALRAEEFTPKVLPSGEQTGYLDGPDGSTWYYTCTLDIERVNMGAYVEKLIKGFKYTIYDAAMNEVGTVEDTIELKEGETKVAAVEIGSQVTKKFFNVDNNYEVMICVSTNTPQYVNNTITRVYTIGNNTPIREIPGYYVSAINTATDAWSEKFWITFSTEQDTQTTEINGVPNIMDFVFTVYKFAGYSGLGDPQLEVRVPAILTAGENALPFMCRNHNGQPWFATAMLKYCYFENPYDYTNENLTPNNELRVQLYTLGQGYNAAVEPYSMTTFPTSSDVQDRQFLYLGNFSYDQDISFDRYTTDGLPSLIITKETWVASTDGYAYDFDVYKAAGINEEAQGQHILNLAKNTDGGYFMDDVRGFDPQVMFIKNNGSNYYYEFTNLINGEVESVLPQYITDDIMVTASTQRVAGGDGYLYVTSQTHAEYDEEENALHGMVYVTPEGEIDHIDYINLGKGIANAQIYMGPNAFNPYIFNLDDRMEYMALVKRYDNGNSGSLHEELVISPANTPYNPLMVLGPNEEYGNLINIWLANIDTDTPVLGVIYVGNDYVYTTTAYPLPLESFTEGDGTAENPYQISSIGQFAKISQYPSAYFTLAGDIDAKGYVINNSSFDFSGNLDGAGHTISNLIVEGRAIFPQVTKNGEDGGVIANLNLVDVEFNPGVSSQGILVGTLTGGRISNIHIYNPIIKADDDHAVGGIAGNAYLNSTIEGCYMTGADVNVPESQFGGIVSQTRTGSVVRACAFSGKIVAGQTVGGIVGDMGHMDDRIQNCHVNSDITALNTIGGIAGTSARGLISNCHVQGSLKATEAPRWGGGPRTGGIVGDLAPFYPGGTDSEGNPIKAQPAVKDNYVNLTSLTSFENTATERYPGQNDTMHRIVGASSLTAEPAIEDYDDDYEPIYSNETLPEDGLVNNYAVSTLEPVNGPGDDANTPEGKSIGAFEADMEFFTGLGFAYGNEIESPWSYTGNPYSPSLFFEGGLLMFTKSTETVGLNETKQVVLQLKGAELTEEVIGGFSCEISDESVLAMEDMGLGEDGSILITVRGLKEGSAKITASIGGTPAECLVIVKDMSGIADVAAEGPAATFDGRTITANGCGIELYNIAGVRMATGRDTLSTLSMQPGIYIVNVMAADGTRRSMKIRVR